MESSTVGQSQQHALAEREEAQRQNLSGERARPRHRGAVLGRMLFSGDLVAAGLAATLAASAAAGRPVAPGDMRRVAAICRGLDGVALAIELTAARFPSLGLDGIEAGLADRMNLLAGGRRADDRPRRSCDRAGRSTPSGVPAFPSRHCSRPRDGFRQPRT